MARMGLKISMVLALATVLWAGAMAQTSSSCANVLLTLSPCLNYITGNSSTPSSACCTQLASVVRSQPLCLCEVLNASSSSLGISINKTRALELPGACKVQTPPISRCSGAASPASSPSPTGSVESPSSTPSGSGTSTTPATHDGGSSNGSSNKLSLTMLFTLLLIASYASTFSPS
ncbi:hypothetical protein Ancab_013323 [Ancistrocladus abbreviatus]